MINKYNSILHRQLPIINKIIQDEIWLEGERRGCPVNRDDPQVLENVCSIILRVGQQIREQVSVQ